MDEPSATPPPEPAPAPAKDPVRRLLNLLALALLVLAGIGLWQSYETRAQMAGLREELARRLRDSDAESRDARVSARQAQEAIAEAQAKLAQLEAKIIESQSQQLALEALYQELSRSRDEWALAEVEQILAIAAQQLQLAGNVQAALVALQTADSRLARSDRPQFRPLRKVLARDIERLKAAPNVDIAGLALKLEQVTAQVDGLPLAFEERTPQEPAGGADAPRREDRFWARIGAEFWSEVKQLVRIRNVERPDPVLLAPAQAFFLRENLKLRLLNARLALIARDENVFREDLRAATAWINRYFDVRGKSASTALATLKQLSASAISLNLPDIAESMTAVRNFKVSRDKVQR